MIDNDLSLNLGSPLSIETWLPGETLFSLASRHHLMSCNSRSSDTCRNLFGNARIGSAHDLPARIDEFVRRTGARFGDAAEILRRHTLLPYYLPFNTPQVAADAVAAMSGSSAGTLKSKLGILATRFGAAHPLKACLGCLKADRETHQVGYWHVAHQLPGVWVCAIHNTQLLASQVKWTGIDRFGWYLPGRSGLVETCGEAEFSLGFSHLRNLANAAGSLWSLPIGYHIPHERLNCLYQRALLDQGLCTAAGRLRKRDFGEAIVSVTRPLSVIHELAALPQDPEAAAAQFSRFVTGTRVTSHPIRHLILCLALFGSWDEMWELLKATSANAPSDTHQPEPPTADSSEGEPSSRLRQELLGALAGSGMSIHAAASRFGVSQRTAMSWAASAGIATPRRAKILKPEIRAALIRTLEQGVDKQIAADNFGVSVQTITTTLLTEVGLHARWKRVRFLKAQREARKAWKKTASKLAVPTPQVLRDLQPAVFAWLYRNDRAWLETFSHRLEPGARSNHSMINWDQRDSEMAQAIKVSVLAWYENAPCARLTIARLCQRIPGLKRRLSRLDRMPLTRAALTKVSGRKTNATSTPGLDINPRS